MTNIKIGLTPKDVVKSYTALTKSEGTLANWRHQKIGPKFYKIGNKKILYRPEDIEAFLFSNPVQTIDSIEPSR